VLGAVIAAGGSAPAPAVAQEAAPEAPPPAQEDSGPRLPYDTVLEGVGDDDLRAALDDASLLRSLGDDPPATVLGLRRRAEQDVVRLRKVLESEGYYAADLRASIESATSPARVVLTVAPGPRYTLESLTVRYAEAPPEAEVRPPRTLDDLAPADPRADPVARRGDPARAETVLQAIDRVRRLLRERGYPGAEVVAHQATVDHAARTMAVTVTARAGRRAVFGPTAIAGAEAVEEGYLRRRIPWAEGQTYDVAAVETYRRRLLATGLFNAVTVEAEGAPGDDGVLPMRVEVEEGDARSIGAGARYSTSLGPAVSTFWEHRNLLGEDEDFRVEGEVSGEARTVTASLAKPHFRRSDQTLTVDGAVASEDFEAYDRTAIETAAGLDRRLSDRLTVGAGLSFDRARLTDGEGTLRSTLFGLPLSLGYDDSDDLLDPRSGLRLSLNATPYAGLYDGPLTFAKLRGELSAYADLFGDGETVLASRLALGATLGVGRSGVPPDKRFYVGGGGSVRGFGYQMAGPLDGDNDPAGGNSLAEASLELRQKITESIGLVPFVDFGRAYEKAVPSLQDDLFLAFGLGGRYYSPIGPVRLDIAIPVDARRDIDDRYQIYVSLGQAF
jgi:translocation and assembly module TamA